METLSAKVEEHEGKYFIVVKVEGGPIRIPLSEDKPNDIKSAFNKLLDRMRQGGVQIALEDPGEDLFSQVASEYLTQLNREIKEVRSEMERNGFAKDSSESTS